MKIYAGTKEVRKDNLERYVPVAEHQLIVQALLLTTVEVGDEAEISAFLAKIDDDDGMTFAVRTRKPHPTREGELKWGTPQGEGWYSFASIESMLGSLQPSKEQRIDFRRDLREAILSPLRDRLRALEEEARLLRPFFPKKDDKKEGRRKAPTLRQSVLTGIRTHKNSRELLFRPADTLKG